MHQPSTPARWVQRSHLIKRLNEGLVLDRQITLVSAPAGFGKTTCISEWLNSLEIISSSWLSLDLSDDDPVRFFLYFLAALQKVGGSIGKHIQNMLLSGQLPPAEIISTTLINDILPLERRFLLVLDDFHLIQDAFILLVLRNLICNMPPALHLVLITREDPSLPLAQLRARNLLTEIRASDLRFNHSDTKRFFNEMMDLDLTSTDIDLLDDKTEGWIVGLQLAGLSMQHHKDPSHLISSLSGSHRFIFSYLTEQVLSQQPLEIQQFLLQTSILHKFNSDLCNAVTGCSDSRAMLDRLCNANLFLIPLDNEQKWFRYHHLFADILRDLQKELIKDQITELHRRASYWFTRAGMINEAVQHAISAKDYSMAIDLLEQHAMSMIMQGYAKTVNSWVQSIPEKWSSHSYKTNLAFVWMHLLRGAYSQAVPYIERLHAALTETQKNTPLPLSEENASLKAELLVIESLRLMMQDITNDGLHMLTSALSIIPENDDRLLGLAYFAQASIYRNQNQYSSAVEIFQKSIKHGRLSESLIVEILSNAGLAQMAFEHGELNLAFEIAAPLSARLEKSGSPTPISGLVYGMLGDIYYQWFQIKQALNYVNHALQMSLLGGYKTGIIFCRAYLSRLLQIEGDFEAAAMEMHNAVDLMHSDVADDLRYEITARQVHLYLAQNQLASAQLTLQKFGFSFQSNISFPDLHHSSYMSHPLGLLYNAGLHVLLYRASDHNNLNGLKQGFDLADRLIDRALQDKYIIVAIEALLFRAQMYAGLGKSAFNEKASLEDYLSALELGEPEGFIGIFIEQGKNAAEALAKLVGQKKTDQNKLNYIESILNAFSKTGFFGTTYEEKPASNLSVEINPLFLIEPLTGRELDVLHLMAEGLKYNEIGAKLYISLNTVRYHVKSIYGKFNVNNRTLAIEMARKLKLF